MAQTISVCKLTFFVEGVRSAVNRDHATTGWVLATTRTGKEGLAVPVKSNVPHENRFCSVIDRTGVAVGYISVRGLGLHEIPTPIYSQGIRPPLYVRPPIRVKQSCTLGKVHFLRRKRSWEFALLIDVSSVTMESGTSKLGGCLLKNLDWVLTALVPVMVIRDDPRAAKTVAVHQRSQCPSNVCLLSSGEYASGIRGVAMFGLVLDANRVGSDSLVPESLQRLQEVRRIYKTIRSETKTSEATRD